MRRYGKHRNKLLIRVDRRLKREGKTVGRRNSLLDCSDKLLIDIAMNISFDDILRDGSKQPYDMSDDDYSYLLELKVIKQKHLKGLL
jgi:hypothetical protein